MKSAIFIINPNSGQQMYQKNLDEIIGKLVLDCFINRCEVVYTMKDRDVFAEISKEFIEEFDFIVAVGGDGTINAVINFIAKNDIEVPLVIMGAGTVNDFANYIKIPKTPNKLVKMIKDFHVVKSDVGKINDHYFINVVAGGMFSDVSYETPVSDKKILGPFGYLLNAVANLPEHLKVNMPLKVKVDEYEFNTNARMFLVANSKHIGGFDKMIPYASIQDGLLDIQILKSCNAVELIQVSTDILAGNHINNRNIEYHQGRVIEISSPNHDFNVDIDGEKGPALPVRIDAISRKLALIVPKP